MRRISAAMPAHCEATIDCRVLPDETPEDLAVRMLTGLQRDLPDWADHLTVALDQANPGLDTPVDRPFARNLLAVCRDHTGQQSPAGVNYFADSAPFHAAGIQTVLFGPGDIAQAHTHDEWVALEQLDRGTEMYAKAIRKWCC